MNDHTIQPLSISRTNTVDASDLIEREAIWRRAKFAKGVKCTRFTVERAIEQLDETPVIRLLCPGQSDWSGFANDKGQERVFFTKLSADRILAFLLANPFFGINDYVAAIRDNLQREGCETFEIKTAIELELMVIDEADHLYLIRHKNGLTKIGRSKDPRAREKTLQAEDPRLHLLGVIRGAGCLEKRLHGILSSERCRGEWFRLSESQCEWILSLRSSRMRSKGHAKNSQLELFSM